MKPHEPITLSRECEAIQIPSGAKMVLPAGTVVMITQSLGDTYTVTTDHGYMVRISGKDADAMGLRHGRRARRRRAEQDRGIAGDPRSRRRGRLRADVEPEYDVRGRAARARN